LPPPLSEGSHRLELAARGGTATAVSDAVTIEVAARAPGTRPAAQPLPATVTAMAAPPERKTAAATPAPEPVAAKAPPAPSAPAADATGHVYVRTVEATEVGRLVVRGSAESKAIVRLYLNGSFLADASAGQDRQWSLTIEHGMSPGLYTIRADEIDRENGKVLARAEVPFSYPQHPSETGASLASVPPAASLSQPSPATPAAEAKPADSAVAGASTAQGSLPPIATDAPRAPANAIAPALPSSPATPVQPLPRAEASNSAPPAAPPTNAVVTDVRTTTVVRGDNLWDLARRFYGDGMRFRQIYDANASQIRDPRLIYIGQIFVVPKETPP
jgi:hypothetical protein